MLHLHRAEQVGTLVPALGQVLAAQTGDPFAPSVVAVSARGVERWLAQRLSHHLGAEAGDDGVCAHVDMPSPGELVARAVAAVQPVEQLKPWQPEELTWQVLDLLDTHHDQEWLADVSQHLGLAGRDGEDAARRDRRFAFAQRTAHRFDRYAATRPRMLAAWRAGRDEDGLGRPLAGHQQWQARIWRLLRDGLGVDPAELVDAAVTILREHPDRSGLPGQVGVFGPSRLDARDLQVLLALAAGHDVHLFLAHPSPVQWERLAGAPGGLGPRHEDPRAALVRNPLLRHLGGDGREFQLQLRDTLAGVEHRDTHHPTPAGRPGLLGRLQRDIAQDREPTPPPAGPVDDSVQFHACHGAARQVEVLRELVTGLLADDPTLEPRDILVMCPQIEDFAPRLISLFGDGAPADGRADDEPEHPGRLLRVRIADRSLRETNPVLDVLAEVITLAGSRLTADEVLALLGSDPVRRRFGLDEDRLEKVRTWVEEAHVRWGLTIRDRTRYGLDLVDNTWQRGLDRVLLGVAMDGDGHRGELGGLPLDGVDSTSVDVVGRVTEFVHRLAWALRNCDGEHPAEHWLEVLGGVVDQLTATTARDAWQQSAARAVLIDALGDRTGGRPLLRLADVRALLEDRLAGRPTRSSFRTGDLTVCSLVPMRSVPHRVVVLLGMDVGTFPRGVHPDGDDITRIDPQVGEPDAAGQERQIFLDALLAAQDRLLVLYSGFHESTGAPRPPAVPVGELLDQATRSGHPLLVQHPLQPADARLFRPDAPPGHFSFDSRARDGAAARLRPRQSPPRGIITHALPPAPAARLDLDTLQSAATDPVAHYLRHVLGLSTWQDEPESSRITVETLGMDEWGVGDRMLRDVLAGRSGPQAWAAERRRGALPPDTLGDSVLTRVSDRVRGVLAAAGPLAETPAGHHPIDLRLPDGRPLLGTAQPLRGHALTHIGYAKLNPRTLMGCWVPLLALVAQTGDPSWHAVLVSRDGENGVRHRLQVPDLDAARRWLLDLVALTDLAGREPLPLPPKTARAYAEKVRRSPQAARHWAEREWQGRYPERAGSHLLKLWPDLSFEELLEIRPLHDRHWTPADEAGWFGELAAQVWVPVMACLGPDRPGGR